MEEDEFALVRVLDKNLGINNQIKDENKTRLTIEN